MTRTLPPRVLLALGLTVVLAAGAAVSGQHTATSMTEAANSFLAALTPELRQQATFPFDSAERQKWNFVPTENFPRNGLLLKSMNGEQRKLAHALLRTALSERGYSTYTQIIQHEIILRAIEAPNGTLVRDPELYRFSIFGTPAPRGAWGWRVEGHHVSLHFTVVNGTAIADTPSFAGSNPAEVRVDGPDKGKRILGVLEDGGRNLVSALDPAQRKTAIIETVAPNEIITTTKLDINPLTPDGLSVSAMTPAQRDLLSKIIDAYAGLMAPELASARLGKIKAAGMEKVAFAWAGPTERGAQHYYRVQGPTFLIEFDNSQNNGNHAHSVWRDFNGDFGRDLLREHLRSVAH